MDQVSADTATPNPDEPSKYQAFISYSHRDARWCDWLHRALETYRVPRRLAGRVGGDALPLRLFPIFRDRDELPTAASLSDSVERALRQSRFLIVICSPHAATSRWVNREVLLFKALGRAERIIGLIVDGQPNATDNPAGGLPECFPPALRHRVSANGELTDERTEPIAADVRPGADDRQTAKLRLIAGLLGVGFDELRQRERQRVLRQRVFQVGLVLAIVASLAGVWQWQEYRRLVQSRRVQTEQLIESGRQELLAGKTERAAVFLSEAYALGGDQPALRVMLATSLRPLDVEIAALRGHTAGVNRAAWSRDGRRLLTVAEDGTGILWDVRTYQSLARLEGHKWFVRQGGFVSDTTLFTVGTEDVVKLWDARDGRLRSTHAGERVAVDHAGGQLVLVSQGQAQIWDVAANKVRVVLDGKLLHLAAVAFSPDDSLVAGVGGLEVDPPPNANPRGRIWDVSTGMVRTYLDGHTGAINSVVFSADGMRVATASTDRTAKVWETSSGRQIVSLGEHPGSVPSALFSRDGAALLTYSESVAVNWNLTREPIQAISLSHPAWINDARFSPDCRRVSTVANDNHARIWDAASGQLLQTCGGHTERVQTVEFSPDSSQLATASSDKTARIWDATRAPVRVFQTTGARPACVTFSPDGSRLAIAGQRAEVWDALTGKALQTLNPHPVWGVRTVAFSQDGERLATASEDRTAKVVHIATGKELAVFRGHNGRVMSANFSHAGRLVVSAALDHSVRVWNADTGVQTLAIDGLQGQLSFAAFSPDDRTIAVACGKSIEIREAHRGTLLTKLPEQATGTVYLAFSPDGRYLASTHGETVTVWNLSTGRQSASCVGHMAQVNRVAFDRQGKLLVTGGEDGTLRLWEAETGKLLLVLMGHRSAIDSTDFSPDGRFVVSSSDDGTVRLWDVSPESRTPESVTKLVRSRVPFKLVEGKLMPK